jgi:predicted transcriptional regulator
MDKYDYLILDIINSHKSTQEDLIDLTSLERTFWHKIESDSDLNIGQSRVGERITNLYLDNLIQNRSGYMLTKRGTQVLSYQTADI